MEALIEAAKNIKVNKSIIVDPIVEPNDLIFNCQKGYLAITYEKQKTIILNKELFIKDIKKAVKELLEILDLQSEREKQQKRMLIIF